MTAASLKQCKCKDLARMAKSRGVVGWHSMRKEELVQALMKHVKRNGNTPLDQLASNGPSASGSGNGVSHSQAVAELRERYSVTKPAIEPGKDIASKSPSTTNRVEQDRLVVMVRDPYWLQVYWELTRQSIDRAQSAMGQFWHSARPVLRIFRVVVDGTSALVRNIPIHGGVSHWYVDVPEPPSQFRTEIGYLGSNQQFYCLARSNSVTTPPAGTSDAVDENWVDVAANADRIFAMSGGYSQRGTSLELQELLEERLGRPMGTPMETRYGDGAARVLADAENLRFSVDAELVVYGISNPNAHVTLQGAPVPLRSDGSFSVRMTLADRRQVIPVVASSGDGLEQRTIILAVERNTKVLEPRLRTVSR